MCLFYPILGVDQVPVGGSGPAGSVHLSPVPRPQHRDRIPARQGTGEPPCFYSVIYYEKYYGPGGGAITLEKI